MSWPAKDEHSLYRVSRFRCQWGFRVEAHFRLGTAFVLARAAHAVCRAAVDAMAFRLPQSAYAEISERHAPFLGSRTHADYQSARSPGTQEDRHQDEESRAPGQPAEA